MIKDFKGSIWMDTRIAFGGVAGCGTFGWMADAWRDIVVTLLGVDRIFRWVDDNMFVKVVGSYCTKYEMLYVGFVLVVEDMV